MNRAALARRWRGGMPVPLTMVATELERGADGQGR